MKGFIFPVFMLVVLTFKLNAKNFLKSKMLAGALGVFGIFRFMNPK